MDNWIQQKKGIYINKEKVQTLIDKQRTNPADVAYLDLDFVAKIVQNFQKLDFHEPIKELYIHEIQPI